MIKHKFHLVIEGLQFMKPKPINLAMISEQFRNLEIVNVSGFDYELFVTKRRTTPIEISIKEAKIEGEQFVDRLSLIENHDIVSFEYLGYLDEHNKLQKESKGVTIKARASALLSNPSEYYNDPVRKKILKTNSNVGLKRAFRTAMSIKDDISKYLVLYGLLYILKGESQKKVDIYIKEKINDILVVSGKHRDQTIITKIRNDIGHPDEDFQMDKVSELVNDYLETLKKLVWELLREV